jgi:hypothetical protein
MGVKEGWHTVPGTSIELPMPPTELGIALITVFLFLPVVILVNRIVSMFIPSAKEPKAAKRE